MYKNLRDFATAIGSAALLFFIASSAAADTSKWCAVYSGVGGSNCGFATIEQCRATVSGIGGFCQPNQFYTGPDKASAKPSQKQAQRKRPPEHRATERRVPEDRFQ